jgi:hypothetical protein
MQEPWQGRKKYLDRINRIEKSAAVAVGSLPAGRQVAVNAKGK